jgi:hypothetical protein
MSSSPSKPAPASWSQQWQQAWEQFWFTPADPRPLAALRIFVGLAALLYLWSFSYDLARWFGPQGLLAQETVDVLARGPDQRDVYRYSLLALAHSPTELWVIHIAAIAAAAAFTLGLATRLSAVLTLVGVLSYIHRAPAIGGLLDPVLSMFLFYLCFAPAGACCSLDRLLGMPWWLAGRDRVSVAATIPLRLMQIHLAALYAVMGASKLYGNAWWDGEAIWLLMAQTHSRPLDLTGLRTWPFLLGGWAHLVAYTQLAFAPLVWSRLTRPVVLALATLTWLSLIPVTGQTLFCLFMIAASVVYLPGWLSSGRTS